MPLAGLDVPSRVGYTFIGWSNNKLSQVADFTTANLATVTSPLTIYAVWQANPYTLNFHSNHTDAGGTNPNPVDKPVTYDKKIGTLPMGNDAPKRIGHQFQGWATTAGATTPNVTEGTIYKEPNDSTIYAVWGINTYTVTFDGNGGGSAENYPKSSATQFNKSLGVTGMPTPLPTREGYDFQGWKTSAIALVPNFDSTVIITNSITVFADWKVQTYSITFDSGDATTPASPAVVTANYDTILGAAMPSNPAKTGHTFEGWSVKKGSKTADFDGTTVIKAPITLHPVWKVIEYKITVEQWFYDYNQVPADAIKGSKVTTELVEYGKSYLVKLEDFSDYNFMKAPSDKDITMVVGDDTIRTYYQQVSYSITAKTEVELDVDDRYPAKSNQVSLQEFIKLAGIEYSSNKIPTARAGGKALPSNVDVTSPDFAALDYGSITTDYDQPVSLDITWPSGQTHSVTLNTRIVDRTAPTITLPTNQRFEFEEHLPYPQNEAELMAVLKEQGLVVSDNYDGVLEAKITYLDGGFAGIPWNDVNKGSIIFISATDKSGNISQQQKAAILTWKRSTNNEGEPSVPDKNTNIAPGDNSSNSGDDSGVIYAEDITKEGTEGVEIMGFGYDEEENVITLNGKPAFKLPKTGGGKAALAIGLLGIPISLLFLLIFLLRRKKEEENRKKVK